MKILGIVKALPKRYLVRVPPEQTVEEPPEPLP